MLIEERWGVLPKFGTLIPGFGNKDEAEKYIAGHRMVGSIAVRLRTNEDLLAIQPELPGTERQPELPVG